MKKKHTTKNRSFAAKNVARAMLANVGKGKRPVMKQILKDNGYPPSMQKNPQKVTSTLSFQETVEPFVKKLKKLQDNLIEELISERRKKTLKKERLLFLSTALKNTIHDTQLLTGGKTDNFGVDELREDINNLINSVKK